MSLPFDTADFLRRAHMRHGHGRRRRLPSRANAMSPRPVSVAFFVVFPLRVGCACAVWPAAAAPRPARGVSSSDKDPPRTEAKHLESDVERGSHSRS